MPLEFWEPLCRGGHHTIHTTPITLNASLCPVPFESPMGVSGLIDLHIGNNGGGRYHDKSNITTQYGDNATLSIICHLYRLISMMYIDSAVPDIHIDNRHRIRAINYRSKKYRHDTYMVLFYIAKAI